MRRLQYKWALDRTIEENRVEIAQLGRLVMILGRFYRHAARPYVSAAAQIWEWRRNVSGDCRVLLDRRFDLPSGLSEPSSMSSSASSIGAAVPCSEGSATGALSMDTATCAQSTFGSVTVSKSSTVWSSIPG
jgi:hypothetical protein